MTTLETSRPELQLASVYDTDEFSQASFDAELADVEAATEIERLWIAEAGLESYATDGDILADADKGKLARVGQGVGYMVRKMLLNWDDSRSDPSHKLFYSPPFVLPEVKEYIEELGREWQQEMGTSRFLSITSLVRSIPYQNNLAKQERKLTIVKDGQISSHQVGLAFDVDGCGIVEETDDGIFRPINPRSPNYQPSLVSESRMVLRSLLQHGQYHDRLNFVEELPGTQEHCFHVALNPAQL